MSKAAKRVKRALLTKRPIVSEISKELLSTGSTQLNLACSGKISGGFPKGTIILLVGDSDSGKTFLSLTCLAEAVLSKRFADYRLIYDGPEFGALMDLSHFFGSETVKRIEAPATDDDGQPIHSQYLEEFYFNVDDAIEDGRPFIYVEDSIDGLEPKEDEDKFKELKKHHKKKSKKEISGTFGTAPAKMNSRRLRSIARKLPDSGSILIIIVQSREAINQMGWGDKKTRAGGRALKFFSALEIWSSPAGEIKKRVNGQNRQLGIFSKVTVKRSRITGKHRTVTIPIYHSFGIDNLGGCVDYLLSERHWKKTKGGINAKEFGVKLPRDKLVRYIESEGRERELLDLVKEVWDGIEQRCKIRRKRRYE